MRVKFACWVIELGIKVLPKEFRNKRFVGNCMKTGHIKVEPPK